MTSTTDTGTKGDLTRKAIKHAMLRIEKGKPRVVSAGCKLSVAAVAKEAGISNASIHNNYPELAELIRGKTNKTTRQQRDEKHLALQQEREKSRGLREEIATLQESLARIASINARLMVENREIKAIRQSPNVAVLREKRNVADGKKLIEELK